jgi:hypothetical protein
MPPCRDWLAGGLRRPGGPEMPNHNWPGSPEQSSGPANCCMKRREKLFRLLWPMAFCYSSTFARLKHLLICRSL